MAHSPVAGCPGQYVLHQCGEAGLRHTLVNRGCVMDPRLLTQPTVSRWQAYSLRLLMVGRGCPLPISADPVLLARTGTYHPRFDPDHMVCRLTKHDLRFVQKSRARF